MIFTYRNEKTHILNAHILSQLGLKPEEESFGFYYRYLPKIQHIIITSENNDKNFATKIFILIILNTFHYKKK